MHPVEIRKISIADLQALQQISRQTFAETFAAANSPENMQRYMEDELSLEKLSEELNNSNSAFYFAWVGDAVAGYLKLNFGDAQTETGDEAAVEIERIYVLKAYQGRKVGHQLYEKAVQVARDAHADYIWLGVWEENTRAINFYRMRGFTAFSKHLFNLGGDEQTDILMKLELQYAGGGA